MPKLADEPENPLHRLSDEQLEAIGREFDELHEYVKEDLGERDAKYIRSIIELHRRLGLIGRAELLVELGELNHHGIEQAGSRLQGGAAFRRRAAVAEEPLELLRVAAHRVAIGPARRR